MPASRARASPKKAANHTSRGAIEKSHRRLFLSIKHELALFERRKRKEIVAYERAFRRCLPRKGKATSKAELLRAADKAQVLLMGDFHPFRQAQKGFLRLVEECAGGLERPVMALECIQQAHQLAVNEFLAGYITVEELREKIEFEKFWPFSWESYRELLQLAKRLGMPVLALNILDRPHHREMLRDRDRAAAERIVRELHEHPQSKIFVLYGELHLARVHLPQELRRTLRKKHDVVVVHQNDPDLYWATRTLPSGEKPEVLRLGAEEFCILNSLPWVKLRSYLDWLEGSTGAGDLGEGSDFADTTHHFAQLLAEALGLPATLREELELFGPDRLASGEEPTMLLEASSAERALCRHALTYQRTTYLRHASALLIPNVNTNSLSEAASFLLWHSQKPPPTREHKATSSDWIALFLVGYLGSKVLNPKRKCSEVADLKQLLAEKEGSRGGLALAKRALALLRPYLADKGLPRSTPPLKGIREIEACRYAGAILGERLFSQLLMQPELLPLVRSWYQCDSFAGARLLLAETSARIGRLRPLHSSKHDRF